MESSRPLRVTPLQAGLVALLVLSALVNYVDRQATAVISPLLIQEFHLSDFQWGQVGAVFSLAYIFTSALGGRWIDRVGIRRGLLVSTVFWSAAAAGHALSGGLLGLCFWRVMLACGEGPGGASLLKGVRRILPPRLQDTGTSLVGAGSLLGALIAPLLVVPLAERFGWRGAFVVTAALGALWVPAWIALSSRPEAHLDGERGGPVPPKGERLDPRSKAVWATGIAIFFTVPPSVFTLSFLARYLSQTFGLSVKELAPYQWQPFLAQDVGQLAGGAVLFWLLHRGWNFLSARRLVMAVGFSGAASMVLMAGAPTAGWAMTWLVLSRLCYQFAYVALLAYGISCVSERQGGAMNGLMNATFGACNFVFNLVIGWLADISNHSFRPALIVVSLSPLVGLAAWWVLAHAAERERIADCGTPPRMHTD